MIANMSPFPQNAVGNGVRRLVQVQQHLANAHRAAHVDEISRFCIHRSLKDRSLEYVLAWIQSRPMKYSRIREDGL
jgi:hypothetical protein